jgi:hypothetical protein
MRLQLRGSGGFSPPSRTSRAFITTLAHTDGTGTRHSPPGMVTLGRFELPTCGLGNRRSIHLSYRATSRENACYPIHFNLSRSLSNACKRAAIGNPLSVLLLELIDSHKKTSRLECMSTVFVYIMFHSELDSAAWCSSLNACRRVTDHQRSFY